jgi:hypothetical protein
VPPRYRTTGIWYANLTGGRPRDVVVTSVGPATGPLGYHHADLQVLSWDAVAARWRLAFDAATAKAPVAYGYTLSSNVSPGIRTVPGTTNGRILDNVDTSIGPVRFAPILATARKQLVFSATFVAAGGAAGTLVVVDFKGSVANVLYTWYGEGGPTWTIHGRWIEGRANYWAPGDSHCCPVRTYRFTVAYTDGSVTEVADQRPWLGVIVRERTGDPTRPLKVVQLANKSPAAGSLRVGDVILDVLNAPHWARGIFDKLSLLNAGDIAHLLIDRGGKRRSVSVRLGSLMKALGQYVPEKDFSIEAL